MGLDITSLYIYIYNFTLRIKLLTKIFNDKFILVYYNKKA